MLLCCSIWRIAHVGRAVKQYTLQCAVVNTWVVSWAYDTYLTCSSFFQLPVNDSWIDDSKYVGSYEFTTRQKVKSFPREVLL